LRDSLLVCTRLLKFIVLLLLLLLVIMIAMMIRVTMSYDWDIAQGIDVTYIIKMTNGDEGDIWHYHFSADEFGKPTFMISVV